MKIGELYQHRETKEIYEAKLHCNMCEMKEGSKFEYPAVLLESTKNKKTLVVPEFNYNFFVSYVPKNIILGDSFESFSELIETAINREFVKNTNSWNSEVYLKFKKTSEALVDGFDKTLCNSELSDKSKELLERFMLSLLLNIEMKSAEKAKADATK